MQSVFQDPFAALNRRKTVEQIVSLPLQVHDPNLGRAERRARVAELLQLVGLRPEHANAYPRQLSGGQCQRVSIARALALGPKFVVLDEAVSAVDVSIQAQILNLLRELQQQLGLTYLFVTHDLSVVRYMASTVAVMYHGQMVEIGSRDSLFGSPQHPYTHALLASIPSVERRRPASPPPTLVVREALASDAGTIPGCRFHPRCPLGERDVCRTVEPPLRETGQGHRAACHFPQSAESLLAAASASARHERRHGDWDALTRDEISAVAADALLVLPVGTTEQHGPHLATGTDAALVEAVAEKAAALAARPDVVLLAPTLAFGASDHHLPFGGTLSLRVSDAAGGARRPARFGGSIRLPARVRPQRPWRQCRALRGRRRRGIA